MSAFPLFVTVSYWISIGMRLNNGVYLCTRQKMLMKGPPGLLGLDNARFG